MGSDSDNNNDIVTDISPIIRVYKDGRVERMFSSPFVPPSPRGQFTGVLFKDLKSPEDVSFVPPSPRGLTTGVSSKDLEISEEVSARLYLPSDIKDSEKLPILVYYHGGGFCTESAFCLFHHRYLNLFVTDARALVVSVEYRLAPEYPLPAAFDDSWTALQWVASHVVEDSGSNKEPWLVNHGNFEKLYVGGDSCGATISHNMAMRAGAECLIGGVKILGALLSHPYFMGSDCDSNQPEYYNLFRGLWELSYPSAPGGIDNPMVNPMADDAPSLSGLGCSKLLVSVTENDYLRKRGLQYAEAVKRSGWEGELEVIDTVGGYQAYHTFHMNEPDTENAKILRKRLASFIS